MEEMWCARTSHALAQISLVTRTENFQSVHKDSMILCNIGVQNRQEKGAHEAWPCDVFPCSITATRCKARPDNEN